MEFTRTLGRSDIEVSALGFGCWAIGGEWQDGAGQPLGWGKVDDGESVRAIHRALDLGVTFFDTADVYGTGHSERILGRALGRRRTRSSSPPSGATSSTRTPAPPPAPTTPGTPAPGPDRLPAPARHRPRRPLPAAHRRRRSRARRPAARRVRGVGGEGLIRAYAWSTDDPARAAVFAEGPHCAAVQHALNVLQDAPEMLLLCERADLASVNRSPLAMGLLTGKHAGRRSLESGGHPQPAARLAAGLRRRHRRGSRVAGARRRAAGRPHRRRAHAHPGRPGLAVGAQPAYRADPRLPVRRPGGGERGRVGEGSADRGGVGGGGAYPPAIGHGKRAAAVPPAGAHPRSRAGPPQPAVWNGCRLPWMWPDGRPLLQL